MLPKEPTYPGIAQWISGVITRLPKYLRLYIDLLVENRVSSKVKVILVAGTILVAAHLGGGPIFKIEGILAAILGPLAFLPTVLLVLVTLDICYQLLEEDEKTQGLMAEKEKAIFGADNSLEQDLKQLKLHITRLGGGLYERIRERWQKKFESAEQKLQKEGVVKGDTVSDDAVQTAVDKLTEMEMSDSLHRKIDKQAAKVRISDAAATKLLGDAARDLTK
jgi:hypothetical protein